MAASPTPGRTLPSAPLLVLASVCSVQFGGALAATLIPLVGPATTVALRIVASAVILLAVVRPRLRGHSVAAWRAAALLGVATGTMNLTFYEALGRLPIGVAVTIEFVGPLLLSAAMSRRLVDAACVAAALAGVVLISRALEVPWSSLDHVGIGFAALAGACWAAYILASRSAGRHFRGVDGLTWAMVVAGVLVAPVGIATAHGPVGSAHVLLGGIGIAVLSSALPYSLEMLALRSMPARVFGILLALEPAVAALAGFVVLGQRLTGTQLAGMALVAGASAAVAATSRP